MSTLEYVKLRLKDPKLTTSEYLECYKQLRELEAMTARIYAAADALPPMKVIQHA